jgi:hypothetical protein
LAGVGPVFTLGNAFEAQHTTLTFTDREMSYDYRDIGTSEHHGGTVAPLLLTQRGQARFNQYEVNRILSATCYTRQINRFSICVFVAGNSTVKQADWLTCDDMGLRWEGKF